VERAMKYFLIKYQFKSGSPEDWRGHIAEFIAALENDPELKGRISYRCMKESDGSRYYHLAATSDDQAASVLQSKDFFKRYNEEMRRVAGGEVEASPLQMIAETTHRA
jgi:hypothetical protein